MYDNPSDSDRDDTRSSIIDAAKNLKTAFGNLMFAVGYAKEHYPNMVEGIDTSTIGSFVDGLIENNLL
jgi:hypothetical protein